MDTTRQTGLQFRRQAEDNAPPPPITTLLSQYEPLILLCQHLSSVDIIHLGATRHAAEGKGVTDEEQDKWDGEWNAG